MLRYSIFDPTGNITALVESPVPAADQAAVAAEIMRLHPETEQVGFVRGNDLRMAGGEFCGNASMCAAALRLLNGKAVGMGWTAVSLHVSGASEPVETRLRAEGGERFTAEIRMPAALGIGTREFAFEGLRAALPLVRLEGISHLVIREESVLFALLQDRPRAERAVCAFCAELGAEGLGLLFLEEDADAMRLTPLVYIPGSGTVFWEKSCASGSAAAGMVLAADRGAPVEFALTEPGGVLFVRCDPRGDTRLRGTVRRLSKHVLNR